MKGKSKPQFAYKLSLSSHATKILNPIESLTLQISMKEHSLSRRKKPTITTTVTTNSSRKLKLVCSFNGRFQRRPPLGKIRYVGGETRILSVERSIGYMKLRSKILEFCPNAQSFCLKYKLPELKSPRNDVETPLVLIASDDDLQCMIDEYDKLELYGKFSRLWIFVCSDDNSGRKNGFGVQFNCNVAKNLSNGDFGVGYNDDLVGKMVLKESGLIRSFNETEMEFAYCDENRKFDHPLIDLASEPHVSLSHGIVNPSFDEICGVSILDYNVRKTPLIGTNNCGHYLHPLNPRDGNVCVGTNSFTQCLVGHSGQVLSNGARVNAAAQGTEHYYNANMTLMYGCPYSKQDVRNIDRGLMSYMNRENSMPWAANCKTHSAPYSGRNQLTRHACPLTSLYTNDKTWGGFQSRRGSCNHCFGTSDTRNQRVQSYHIRNRRNNLTKNRNHRVLRLDGRFSLGKCYPVLKPNSDISKKVQFERSHHPNSWKQWSGFHDHVLEGRAITMDCGLNKGVSSFNVLCKNEKLREKSGLEVRQNRNSNPKDCNFVYHGICAEFGEKLDTQVDFLTGLKSENNEVPDQNFHKNLNEVVTNCESIHDHEKKYFLMDPRKAVNTSGLSGDPAYGNGTKLGFNNRIPDTQIGMNSLNKYSNGTYTLQGGLTSSMDVSLHNLSLSSTKEVEPSVLRSIAGDDLSEAFWKPKSKPLDSMEDGKVITGPQSDESNGGASCVSSHNAAKFVGDHLQKEDIQQDPPSCLSIVDKANTEEIEKYSKAIGGISPDLTPFYTHLATRELQTIKNSDLEYVKELGSGTYGTVFYGKWKGSDVAIKKIKPSCFIKGAMEDDRLVADFWREAHILGQLHHPNIVAFYGVVTDGPVASLATVTEYMVNGSLKQVLERKDRTIDRRKRLIIAMEAAFGMEYLHGKNIVHFDLKSHNFLVNMRDPQHPVCKIGDLGLSKIKQRTLISGGVRGTIPWMAPELLNCENNLVTEKVDVYSFGIVMWELLTGEEPYVDLRSEEIIAGIISHNLRPEIPSWCEPFWRSLMERCWSSDPSSRPHFSKIAKLLREKTASLNIK